MPTTLFRPQTPAEAELADRRRELRAVRATLADREFSLAALRAHLHNFEARYIRQVGVLYRQLDEWEERIAELKVSQETPEERERLLRNASTILDEEPPQPEADAPQPSLTLRNLFRELAKLIHPDHAINEQDERHRTRLMAQANEAYRRDDAAILQRMLNGYDPSTDPASSEIGAEIARVLRQIEQVRADASHVAAEIETLAQSELAQLEQRTILAATNGRDLLAEMAARVKGSIGIAMRAYELDLSRARRKPAGPPVESLLSAEALGPR